MRFEDLAEGDSAENVHTVRKADITAFAELTGDLNPVHMDEEAAKRTPFGGVIAHGLLSVSYMASILGMQLPGPGTIYLSQTVRFLKPVRVNDTVTARVTVVEKIPSKRRVRLATSCSNQAGETVFDGEALVMMQT